MRIRGTIVSGLLLLAAVGAIVATNVSRRQQPLPLSADDVFPPGVPLTDEIVFLSNRDGVTDLYRSDLAGTIHRLTATVAEETWPSVSADGKWLGYVVRESRYWSLHLLDLISGRAAVIASTRYEPSALQVSSDHEAIAYVEARPHDRTAVMVADTRTSTVTQLALDADQPFWLFHDDVLGYRQTGQVVLQPRTTGTVTFGQPVTQSGLVGATSVGGATRELVGLRLGELGLQWVRINVATDDERLLATFDAPVERATITRAPSGESVTVLGDGSDDAAGASLWLVELASGVTTVLSEHVLASQWSANGTIIAYTQPGAESSAIVLHAVPNGGGDVVVGESWLTVTP